MSDNGEGRREAAAWWGSCATSPEFRRVAQAAAADGFIVSVSDAGTCGLSFIDDDFPFSTPVSLRRALARRELQVVGTAPYEMSLLEATSGGLSLVVMFQEPAHVTVYADESKQGGVVIVATEARWAR